MVENQLDFDVISSDFVFYKIREIPFWCIIFVIYMSLSFINIRDFLTQNFRSEWDSHYIIQYKRLQINFAVAWKINAYYSLLCHRTRFVYKCAYPTNQPPNQLPTIRGLLVSLDYSCISKRRSQVTIASALISI